MPLTREANWLGMKIIWALLAYDTQHHGNEWCFVGDMLFFDLLCLIGCCECVACVAEVLFYNI